MSLEMIGTLRRRPVSPSWSWWLAGTVSMILLTAVPLVWSTVAWAEELSTAGRLLPGTHVANVDVGGQPVSTARELVAAEATDDLDRPRTLTHQGAQWEVTPRELGASVDVRAAIRRARAATAHASLIDLVRARWRSSTPVIEVDALAAPSETAVAEFIADVADDVDHPPRDATLEWTGARVELVADEAGHRVDRGAAAAALSAALRDRDAARSATTVPVATSTAEVTAEELEPLVDAVARAAERAADRTVTLVHDDTEWELAPDDVDATPDVDALVDAVRDGDAGDELAGERALALAEESITAYVDGLAAEIDREARDAELDYADGWVDVTPSRPGRELDRDRAADEIADALATGAEDVTLPVEPIEPARTADDYEHVLLVRRDERRLYHYVDGEVAREWPVAVGGGGSPTPTGEFTVGAKRHRPTWHNPSPEGWGADMPERIGPGRDNPLGLRALNWNRDGGDTLIRFHGTAAVSSIGRAASQGCVRLTNDDVLELYERTPTGATIVSV